LSSPNQCDPFDTHQQSPLWTFSIPDAQAFAPTITTDGTLYIGASNNFLYAVAPDGSQKWSFETQAPVIESAIAADGTIYIGNGDNLYAINPDGTKKWSLEYRIRVVTVFVPTAIVPCIALPPTSIWSTRNLVAYRQTR
jgi:outer membrane protein assembly factor BamB